MKNKLFNINVLLVTLSLSAVLTAISCKKEEKSNPANTIPHTAKLDGEPVRDCDLVPTAVVSFPEEPEEQTVDEALYALAYALRSEIARPDVADYIFNTCASDEGQGEIAMAALFNAFPDVRDNVENNLATTQLEGIPHFSNYDELVAVLVRRGVAYDPIINIPNLETATINFAPLLSPGIEIASAVETDDDIFVWNILGTDYRPGAINRGEAMNTGKPVMVTSLKPKTPQTPQQIGAFRRTINGQVVNAKTTASPHLASNEFMIKHRYEKNKYSDVAKVAFIVRNIANIGNWIYGNKNPYSIQVVKQVHKNDINTQQSSWAYTIPELLAGDIAYYNFFEEDWYAGTKNLGSVNNYQGKSGYVQGRMKFDDEWYLIHPDNATTDPAKCIINHNLWTQLLSVGTMLETNDDKSWFREHIVY